MEKAVVYARIEEGSDEIANIELEAKKYCDSKGIRLLKVHAEYFRGSSTSKNIRILQTAIQEVFTDRECVLLTPSLNDIDNNLACVSYLVKTQPPLLTMDSPSLDVITIRAMLKRAEDSIRHRINTKGQNVKKGIEKAKLKGKKLGSPEVRKAVRRASEVRTKDAMDFSKTIFPILKEIERDYKGEQITLRDYKFGLEKKKILTKTGKKTWQESSIRNIIKRIEES